MLTDLNSNAPSSEDASPITDLLIHALTLHAGRIMSLTPEGERFEADALTWQPLRDVKYLLCHRQWIERRLSQRLEDPVFDILELFFFLHPTLTPPPTLPGLCRALGLQEPCGQKAETSALTELAAHLLRDIQTRTQEDIAHLAAYTQEMMRDNWAWGPDVLLACGKVEPIKRSQAFAVWERLPKWRDAPNAGTPVAVAGQDPISDTEVLDTLAHALETKGVDREDRPEQRSYTLGVAQGLNATYDIDEMDSDGNPLLRGTQVTLAEAGTGVGKTLSCLAAAKAWSVRNGGRVWISTYTRNLQQQTESEARRLFQDAKELSRKVAIRKGRENYICLLNLQESELQGEGLLQNMRPHIARTLMTNWAGATRDGRLTAGDFPGWAAEVIGMRYVSELADRRGECIHTSCRFYSCCFSERMIRHSHRAQIVIVNHALTLSLLSRHAELNNGEKEGASGGDELTAAPLADRIIFDESHHLLSVADDAFATFLTGSEAAELRRWLMGRNGGGRQRARGLAGRLSDILEIDAQATEIISDLSRHTARLPAQGWRQRVFSSQPVGRTERFLSKVFQHVMACNASNQSPYSFETGLDKLPNSLKEAAAELLEGLRDLVHDLNRLQAVMVQLLDAKPSPAQEIRSRIVAASQGLEGHVQGTLNGWISMLNDIIIDMDNGNETSGALESEEMINTLIIERNDGRNFDVGYTRRFRDPGAALMATLDATVSSVVMTSATLRDVGADTEIEIKPENHPENHPENYPETLPKTWDGALRLTGTRHAHQPVQTLKTDSPFDYNAQTKVLVVTDVDKAKSQQVSGAVGDLMLASEGGGLALFTAISRLKTIYHMTKPRLEAAGLLTLGQHVDELSSTALIDIFRAEEDSCLFGVDAVRDGIDVPGRSLRLMICDRVPWGRADRTHRLRKASMGKNWEDALVRLRLRQAYGRLIRRATDRGVFVILDAATPSRLLSAFPEGVTAERVSLKDAIEITAHFTKEEGL